MNKKRIRIFVLIEIPKCRTRPRRNSMDVINTHKNYHFNVIRR